MDEAAFWTQRRIGGFLAFLLAIGIGWFVIARLLEKDRLFMEAASPDGRLVARIWCSGSCPLRSARTLAISDAGRDVGVRIVEQSGDVFIDPPPREGDLPGDDVVTDLRWVDGTSAVLRWTGPRSLQVEQLCLTDGQYGDLPPTNFRGVSIRFARTPLPANRRFITYQTGETSELHYLNEEEAQCARREGRG